MKATHLRNSVPVSLLAVKFKICAATLEYSVVSLLSKGIQPTKKLIKEDLINMFTSGGADGSTDWVDDDDFEKHIDKARVIAQKLYPSFYTIK